ALSLPDGTIVAALVAVNSLGDVIDPDSGRVIAGARGADNRTFVDARTLLRAGTLHFGSELQNTVLGVVATNASLTKTQARRVAEMTHDGYARAIAPAHTPVDGDTVFVLATGAQS